MTWEQRKTFRFKPRNRIFASLGSNLSQVGKVVDISLCGLSFEFVSDTAVGEDQTHVDIFTIDEGCSLYGLPCSPVYQSSKSLPGQKTGTEEAFMTRRCGIKFHNLQPEQWFKLADVIEETRRYGDGETSACADNADRLIQMAPKSETKSSSRQTKIRP